MNTLNKILDNRLEERFKTCVKRRGRSSKYKKVYQENRRGQFGPEVFDHHQFCTRCFKIKPKIDYGEENAIIVH